MKPTVMMLKTLGDLLERAKTCEHYNFPDMPVTPYEAATLKAALLIVRPDFDPTKFDITKVQMGRSTLFVEVSDALPALPRPKQL